MNINSAVEIFSQLPIELQLHSLLLADPPAWALIKQIFSHLQFSLWGHDKFLADEYITKHLRSVTITDGPILSYSVLGRSTIHGPYIRIEDIVENHTITERVDYVYGKKHGMQTIRNERGLTIMRGQYSDGWPTGQHILYSHHGSLVLIHDFNTDGTGELTDCTGKILLWSNSVKIFPTRWSGNKIMYEKPSNMLSHMFGRTFDYTMEIDWDDVENYTYGRQRWWANRHLPSVW